MYSRVYVEITNICNMHCSFCHGHQRPPRQMTRQEYAHILQQLKGKTQYIYHHLMGEPLVHPLLPEFMQMAKKADFRPMLTTNGTLLDTRGDALLDKGLHKVNISVHSFEDGTPAAYAAYIRKIVDFADNANRFGTLISLRLWNQGFDDGRNDETLQLLQKHLQGQWTPNTRGYRIRDGLFLEWGDRFEWPDLDAPDYGNAVFCHGLKDHFGILSDGTVVPCCLDSDGNIPLGNAFEEDLSAILSSQRAVAIFEGFRNRTAAEELCRHCAFAQKF